MIASQIHELLWAAVIPACLAFIAAVVTAIIAWLNHRTGKDVAEQVRPENGTRTGLLLEQISKTVDAIDGRIHETSKRVDSVEGKLDGHIIDTAPLVARAIRDWGSDGTNE